MKAFLFSARLLLMPQQPKWILSFPLNRGSDTYKVLIGTMQTHMVFNK
jgi:hypothetical protein